MLARMWAWNPWTLQVAGSDGRRHSRCGKRSGSSDNTVVGRVTSPQDGHVLPLGL